MWRLLIACFQARDTRAAVVRAAQNTLPHTTKTNPEANCSTGFGSTMSAMAGTEVKLFASAKERRKFDDLADLYSILVATEHLEKAFGRDAVTAAQYETQCSRLISQFKLSEAALRADGTVGDVGDFMDQYSMDCPRARERLLRHGVPATVLHAESRAGAGAGEALAAETTQHFITAMDALKLEERAVDSVQPLLQALMSSIARMPLLPSEHAGPAKLRAWLQKLNEMRAMEELSDDQARQLSHDLETAYSEFMRFLTEKSAK